MAGLEIMISVFTEAIQPSRYPQYQGNTKEVLV